MFSPASVLLRLSARRATEIPALWPRKARLQSIVDHPVRRGGARRLAGRPKNGKAAIADTAPLAHHPTRAVSQLRRGAMRELGKFFIVDGLIVVEGDGTRSPSCYLRVSACVCPIFGTDGD